MFVQIDEKIETRALVRSDVKESRYGDDCSFCGRKYPQVSAPKYGG